MYLGVKGCPGLGGKHLRVLNREDAKTAKEEEELVILEIAFFEPLQTQRTQRKRKRKRRFINS
jgi:hypothetical protein